MFFFLSIITRYIITVNCFYSFNKETDDTKWKCVKQATYSVFKSPQINIITYMYMTFNFEFLPNRKLGLTDHNISCRTKVSTYTLELELS